MIVGSPIVAHSGQQQTQDRITNTERHLATIEKLETALEMVDTQ